MLSGTNGSRRKKTFTYASISWRRGQEKVKSRGRSITHGSIWTLLFELKSLSHFIIIIIILVFCFLEKLIAHALIIIAGVTNKNNILNQSG